MLLSISYLAYFAKDLPKWCENESIPLKLKLDYPMQLAVSPQNYRHFEMSFFFSLLPFNVSRFRFWLGL